MLIGIMLLEGPMLQLTMETGEYSPQDGEALTDRFNIIHQEIH